MTGSAAVEPPVTVTKSTKESRTTKSKATKSKESRKKVDRSHIVREEVTVKELRRIAQVEKEDAVVLAKVQKTNGEAD